MSAEEKPPVTLEDVLAVENLNAAWAQVKTNAGAAGVDGRSVAETAELIGEHKEEILEGLRSGRYRPDAVRAVEIPKANGGTRGLGIPTVLDRLIQQAIHQKLGPLWEREFSEHSYGFRPNRSAHDAVRAAQGHIRAGKSWVVDLDLKSFFDHVNHDRLMHHVGRKVRDKRLLRLIGEYLRAPMRRRDGREEPRREGTPQGGPLSPLLANIYLHPLDQELEKRGLSFVRYADDIAIFCSSERAAARVKASVIAWIERELKLPVNREKSGHGPSDGTALLGFRLETDGTIRLAPKSVERLKTKVRELWDARQSLTSEELREQWRNYMRGWWGYFRLAEKHRDVTDLSGWIRRHMRKCFWLRWHHPRGRRNALQRLGLRGVILGMASSRKGAWAIARHWVLHRALSNRILHHYGFTLPWETATTSVVL
jgi:group II intron reverse transcriptase/maturase